MGSPLVKKKKRKLHLAQHTVCNEGFLAIGKLEVHKYKEQGWAGKPYLE